MKGLWKLLGMKGKLTLEGYVESVVTQMGKEREETIVLLDTGAVIDYERMVSKLKLKQSTSKIEDFYDKLQQKGLRFFISDGIFEEIEDHHVNHLVHGYPEISLATMTAISPFYDSFARFNREHRQLVDYEQVRYAAYWASKFCFDPSHKKVYQDPPSDRDKNLVATGFWVSEVLSILNNHMNGGNRVTVVSPDDHIHRMARVLSDNDSMVTDHYPQSEGVLFGYKGVKVVNSR